MFVVEEIIQINYQKLGYFTNISNMADFVTLFLYISFNYATFSSSDWDFALDKLQTIKKHEIQTRVNS